MCGLRMLAAKNSRKRIDARSLAAGASAGTGVPFQAPAAVAVIGTGRFVIAGALRANGYATTPRP